MSRRRCQTVCSGVADTTFPQFFFDALMDFRETNSGGEVVAMMQTAKPWHRGNRSSSGRLVYRFPAGGCSLCQCEISAVLVVVADVIIHETLEMLLVQNNHMIEQVAAAAADPALGDAVLPRTPKTGPLGLDAEALDRFDHLRIEAGAAIKDQVAGRRVIWKCLAQLLNYPCAGRMLGHIAMQDPPLVMRNDEEAIENSKGECRHGEEVHCGNGLAMVVQEGDVSPNPRKFCHRSGGLPNRLTEVAPIRERI